LRNRLFAVEILMLAKEKLKYRDLSRILNMAMSVVSRYVKGHILPCYERSKKIIETLAGRQKLREAISDRIYPTEQSFDHFDIAWNMILAEWAAEEIVNWLAGRKVTKILASRADSAVFAYAIARRIGLKQVLIAKRYLNYGITRFFTSRYPVEDTYISLYIPARLLKARDSVVIVSDIIRTGNEEKALIQLVKRARSKIEAIVTLIAVGDQWKEKLEEYPVKTILKINSNP